MRTYVVCIDGTWNHPGQTDKDMIDPTKEDVTETNVLQMYAFLTGVDDPEYGTIAPFRASPRDAPDADNGEVIYLNGVGSAGTVANKVYEGSTGTGTSERIRDAYRFICARHRQGDRIFIFGFSRGAYAARSLAGFLQFVGLPKLPRVLQEEDINAAFVSYRLRGGATKGKSFGRDATVDFLGVWDTVGALAFGDSFNDFHLISPTNVSRVAHALALDEQRKAFQPEYWGSTGNGATIEEVWFAGVHTNVGGGYIEYGLSDITLWWMISKAVAGGLPNEPDYANVWKAQNVEDIVRDSYTEFLSTLSFVGKVSEIFHLGKINRTILSGQKIHATVFDRINRLAAETPPRSYLPAAHLVDGSPFPASAVALGTDRIETSPDTL